MTFDERNAMTCLEDLKFKAEEIPSDYGPLARRAHMATELNRILAEKLTPLLLKLETELHELRKLKEEVERAPEVYDHSNGHGRRWHVKELKPPQFLTHKARLVCLKPIKE